MNVYDFDGTIYNGDSTLDFYIYCVKRHPMLLRYLPGQVFAVVKYKMNCCDKTQMKEQFYSFLKGMDYVEDEVRTFWSSHKKKIATWFIERKDEDSVVISASPEFLLAEICGKLGVRHLIASRVDRRTGKYDGENCYGMEKARRFRLEFGDINIDEFYTDSKSDLPMANIAACAYIKVCGRFIPWDR